MVQTVKVQKTKFDVYEPPKPEEGSLWSEMSEVGLFQDMKARKVGDIVTVRIIEDPEAELNANTKTSRTSSIDAAKLKFLGYMKALARITSYNVCYTKLLRNMSSRV